MLGPSARSVFIRGLVASHDPSYKKHLRRPQPELQSHAPNDLIRGTLLAANHMCVMRLASIIGFGATLLEHQ